VGFRSVSDWARDIAYGLPREGLPPLDLPPRPEPRRPLSPIWCWAIALLVLGALWACLKSCTRAYDAT